MSKDEIYMHRCIQLALLGQGNVAPNPMVGAVLVHNDIIIGEGYHALYGKEHAEVACINSVLPHNHHLIKEATLYVSLEPCAHYGKTPPCADHIVQKKIKKVVIGCIDTFAAVAGKGIQKLKSAGIEVVIGILDKECKELNKRFFTFHKNKRPYIVLKWAQSGNGKIGGEGNERILISNEFSNRLVHKWRSEEAAILVGTNTARLDDPSLTTRLWPGTNPVRLVLDRGLALPDSLKIFNSEAKSIVFNEVKNEIKDNISYHKLNKEDKVLPQILNALYNINIQSVLVEGGRQLLQSFIDEEAWDEVRIITNEHLMIPAGTNVPSLNNQKLFHTENLKGDTIHYYQKN
ncbi:MAG TPA: bifunctional diaminohydroxyphosphoribosylaminopyrimidine deaminase/5-amino-6-(5-phosphoribosylamino)uracil reductase RibD, partial [Chitinophagaceae bacterium]|nr:bifunctional diaminohydroxyphosphoribosylaminopyrimidine deaminase/5-amino-6-(5-phosphoribosylamino)uracil reductase RibD [Chitinophagaceae bacterium]